jgi:pimeloyl-ACP methyl ester carboxylesterase
MKLARLRGIDSLFTLLTTRGQIRSSLQSAYYDDEQVTERTVDTYYYSMRTEGAMWAVLARIRNPRNDAKEWQARIRELDIPTFIIWGANDTWIPPQDAINFHNDIAGSRLLIFPECGHLPQEEAPEAFFMAVLNFMSGKRRDLLVTKAPRVEPAERQPQGIST